MGIRKEATLAEAAWSFRCRRMHRTEILNVVEENLDSVRVKVCSESDDVSLRRGKSRYKSSFSTKETWFNLRTNSMQLKWLRGVWFSMATPRFTFIVWLAMQNRLSTMDRVVRWSQGVDVNCVLCKNDAESRDHLFFRCAYSVQLWSSLVKGILGSTYSEDWESIVKKVSEGNLDRKSLFCLRYTFHAATYATWREKNRVKHGEKAMHINTLIKLTDKGIRNKLSLVKLKGKKDMEDVLWYWFQLECSWESFLSSFS